MIGWKLGNLFSRTRVNNYSNALAYVTLLIGWCLVLRSSQHLSFCANSTFFSIEKMNKCIRMGITASNLSFGEVNRRFYGRKLCFTAPLMRRRKMKFPTVNRRFTSPNAKFESSYPLTVLKFIQVSLTPSRCAIKLLDKWHSVKTLISCHILWLLIWVYSLLRTVCPYT